MIRYYDAGNDGALKLEDFKRAFHRPGDEAAVLSEFSGDPSINEASPESIPQLPGCAELHQPETPDDAGAAGGLTSQDVANRFQVVFPYLVR